jgi:hypothetical protein
VWLCACVSLVTFYGAFHREGFVSIALEYMNGGSLSNVIFQMGCIPEPVLASVVWQILWGMAYLKHEHKVHRVRAHVRKLSAATHIYVTNNPFRPGVDLL